MSCVRSLLFSKGHRVEMFWGHHFHPSLMCQYAWQGVVDVFMPLRHRHTHKHIFVFHTQHLIHFVFDIHTHTSQWWVLYDELNCHCSGRKAWIILLVFMFSIILNPPGMVYSCPLPSLSNSCSHPSVSYVILPQINTGHDCSTFIGPCFVHTSHRCFVSHCKLWMYYAVAAARWHANLLQQLNFYSFN